MNAFRDNTSSEAKMYYKLRDNLFTHHSDNGSILLSNSTLWSQS
jgi:hypothetical protein